MAALGAALGEESLEPVDRRVLLLGRELKPLVNLARGAAAAHAQAGRLIEGAGLAAG